MNAQLRILAAVGVLSLAAACAMQRPVAISTPVGPVQTVAEISSTTQGFLTVYTASKTYPVDDETWYRAHTAYGIYDLNGHRLMSIRNAATYHDSSPKTVALPEGNYTIRGWTDGYELVQVPVVIQPGRVTMVNLEANKNRRFPNATDSAVVREPDGTIIGWVASTKE